MKIRLIFFLLVFLGVGPFMFGQNLPPIIDKYSAQVNWATKQLTLEYEVSDAENDPLDISFDFSTDGGKTYSPGYLLFPTGDLGFPVSPGLGKKIVCDATLFAGTAGAFQVRLMANDRQPFDFQWLVNQVDSNRLRDDLRFVEGIRHRTTGAAHLQAVRDSLQRHFESLDLNTQIQTFTYANSSGKNIIGTLSGISDAVKVVVIDAHYDSVSNAPGADDNGSGTVGVMECARVLAQFPAKKSLRFIGFDLEEAGLIGSQRYVTSGIPAGEAIEGVFNFEMIGYYSEEPGSQSVPTGFNLLFPDAYNQLSSNDFRGDFITNVGNVNSQTLVDLFKSSATQYVPGLSVVNVVVPGNGQVVSDLRRSDHAPFWDSGRKALMLTDGADFRNECYHTPGDTASEKLDFTFMSNVVKATVAAAAQLAEIQHADWALATFENTVRTGDPDLDNCRWQVTSPPDFPGQIDFTVLQCAVVQVNFELFDEKGALVFSRQIVLSENGTIPVQLGKNLPNGLYFVKISHENGSETQKLIIQN